MTHKLEIEAALERSLRAQVKAPRLDGRFDAAVWSRIEAAAQSAPVNAVAARPSTSAHWLFIINAIGIAVTLVLVVYFGAQAFGDVQVTVPKVATPEISATAVREVSRVAVLFVTGAALLFGLMFTSLGRRLRSELKQFL
jgi:hypothetical protein